MLLNKAEIANPAITGMSNHEFSSVASSSLDIDKDPVSPTYSTLLSFCNYPQRMASLNERAFPVDIHFGSHSMFRSSLLYPLFLTSSIYGVPFIVPITT